MLSEKVDDFKKEKYQLITTLVIFSFVFLLQFIKLFWEYDTIPVTLNYGFYVINVNLLSVLAVDIIPFMVLMCYHHSNFKDKDKSSESRGNTTNELHSPTNITRLDTGSMTSERVELL